jgi:hypothetical protein
MAWSKLVKEIDLATSMMFLYLPNNANKYITHTLIPLKMIIIELIGYSLWKSDLEVMSKLLNILTMK